MTRQRETALKLTSYHYKRPEVSDQEFWEFGLKDHAPKAARIQQRHGVLKVTQSYTPAASKEMMAWATQMPGWELADHDVEISVWVHSPSAMQAVLMDPEFQALMAQDASYTLHDRARVTAGWEEVLLDNGQLVEPDMAATFNQRASLGQSPEA